MNCLENRDNGQKYVLLKSPHWIPGNKVIFYNYSYLMIASVRPYGNQLKVCIT